MAGASGVDPDSHALHGAQCEVDSHRAPVMQEFLTTREVAALLRVKERKVYELASSGDVPCTRAMGKLLFPRDGIERWLNENGSGYAGIGAKTLPNVFLGSHDPLLDWALRESKCGLATFFDGSLDGLDRFENGDGVATGLHVYDAGGDTWNLSTIQNRFAAKPVVLSQWVWRERGLIVRPEHDGKVTGIADIKSLKLVPRQAEAGSQQLLEWMLTDAGIKPSDMATSDVSRTETDAAIAVYEGTADVAFGLRSLAEQYRLSFVPLMRERFDLLIDRRSWFEPPMLSFAEFCRSDTFRKRAADYHGYDLGGMGTILFNGAA